MSNDKRLKCENVISIANRTYAAGDTLQVGEGEPDLQFFTQSVKSLFFSISVLFIYFESGKVSFSNVNGWKKAFLCVLA